jgi:hypothetical protein
MRNREKGTAVDYVGHFEREAAAFEAAARRTASDLALFLWQRPVTGRLDVRGDSSLLERYFVLVPPL